jgi:multidrug resistance efflux pump
MIDRGQRLDWFESPEIVAYAAVKAAAFDGSGRSRQTSFVLAPVRQIHFRRGAAVINARLTVIRAPIDGIATAAVTTPGSAIVKLAKSAAASRRNDF